MQGEEVHEKGQRNQYLGWIPRLIRTGFTFLRQEMAGNARSARRARNARIARNA